MGGVLPDEAPDTTVDTTGLDLGGWAFCITGQDKESATVFVGLLLAVARELVWFRMRLSWVDGRPEDDHERVLYAERLCCW